MGAASFWLSAVSFAASVGFAYPFDGVLQPPPDVICRAEKTVWIEAGSLASQVVADTTVYEIIKGDLYITPSDRTRYRYGRFEVLDRNRFSVGYLTLLFTAGSRRVTIVHADEQIVRVTTAGCR